MIDRTGEMLTGLRVLAASEARLREKKLVAVELALLGGLTRAQVAEALGISVDQLDYLNNRSGAVAKKRSRPSVKQELPGESAKDYALRTGQKPVTIEKQLQQGRFPGQVIEVEVGQRTFKRIVAA